MMTDKTQPTPCPLCGQPAVLMPLQERGHSPLQDISDLWQEIVDERDVLSDQRDELLAALSNIQGMAAEDIRTGHAHVYSSVWQIEADARAAIDEAKEADHDENTTQ